VVVGFFRLARPLRRHMFLNNLCILRDHRTDNEYRLILRVVIVSP
jgi:hypothetical protein